MNASWSDGISVFLQAYLRQFLHAEGQYLAAAALFWFGILRLLRARRPGRVVRAWPTPPEMRRDAFASLGATLVNAAVGVTAGSFYLLGDIEIYANAAAHGWLWLVVSFPLLLLWHDAYFYWTHRLLHTPWLFRHVHIVHHRSTDPSPWTGYAFHPAEALIHALTTPLVLAVVPLHSGVLIAYAVHQVLRNMQIHSSMELLPRGFAAHAVFGWFSTTTHHHLHHEDANGRNYGLWFAWWDRLCGTEHPDYQARFAAATTTGPSSATVSAGASSVETPYTA